MQPMFVMLSVCGLNVSSMLICIIFACVCMWEGEGMFIGIPSYTAPHDEVSRKKQYLLLLYSGVKLLQFK